MSYLAAGIQQGWETGSRAIEAKRKRQQEDELEKARRSLQLETQARELRNRNKLADAELTFRATSAKEDRNWRSDEAVRDRSHRSGESERDRGFRGAEAERDRGFRRNERIDSQGFQSSEAQLDRAARVLAQDKELKQRTDFFDLELPLKGADLGLKMRAQEWQENPQNPYNRIRATQADMNEQELGPDTVTYRGTGAPPVTGQFRPAAPAGGRNAPVNPPEAAIDMLRKNPTLAGQFDSKYGQGAAARYLNPRSP